VTRRELILTELGLTPLWVRRRAALVAQETDAVQSAVQDLQPLPTAHPLPADNRGAQIGAMDWQQLKSAVATCTSCVLHKQRRQAVFGVGDESAEWLFVGEGPGAEEDARGEPFVGQAGKLLDNMLAAIGLKRDDNVYIANVVKCLRYNALVQLGDGRWERIGRLVASSYSGDVMSLDATGALVRRRVVGWHSSPLADRRVFRLSYVSAKSAGASKSGVQLTGDHLVLTNRGWIAVQDLRRGDCIATGQGLSQAAFDVVCGTLLGDGHIAAHNAHLSMSHCERQSDYVHLKADMLAELDCHVESLAVTARVGDDRRYPVTRMRTRAHRALSILRRQFYGARKRVPSWIETRLNDRMLAFWFMDDGYMRVRENRQPRAEIATCGFSEDDVQRLLHGLSNLGISAKSLRGRIHFDIRATRTLSERIAPFVIPCMRYKLHPEVAGMVPFDPARLSKGPIHVLYDEVEAVEIMHAGTDKTFFCLDVEDTHNFITSGGVVHNCRPPGNRTPEPAEANACEPYLARQIGLIKPRLIIALGKVAAQNLLGTEATIASLRGRAHTYRGTPLIVTYHPAYLLRNLTDKAKAWEDLCFAVDTMKALKQGASIPN
jgi:uracil-DNA glycosylase family 4